MKPRLRSHMGALIVLILSLSACVSQTPILVYVTPTTVESPQAILVQPTVSPISPLALAGVTTATSVPTIDLTRAVVVGSVIGSDYVLPPTPTPAPTETLILSPTLELTISLPEQPAPTLSQPTVQGTALPNLDPLLMGIQLDPTLKQDDWNQAVADIQRLGMKWLKVQVAWKSLQPNGPGEITEDFRRLEIYLETAFNAGLDILVSVAKAPNWARSTLVEDGPPDDPQNLVIFINLMLQEFGTSLDAIEIWNEPNLSREWQGQPLDGASYMRYFVPAHQAINAYSEAMRTDPKTPRAVPIAVITAGLAPTGDNATLGSRNDRTYLQEMYTAGMSNYADAQIGIHPYGWANPPDSLCCQPGSERGWDDDNHFFFLNNVNDFHEIMVRNGHTSARLWATEFGWATWDGLPGEAPQPWMAYADRWAQGNYAVRTFEIGQSLDYMGPMILWNLNFAILAGMVENRDERAAYSLIVPLQPRERPAYWMLYDAIRPDLQLDRYD